MKEDTLKRLLSLIEKTGDRLVITDPAGEHPYVLMGLDHYEKLVVGEWKPESLKREPPPPHALPISVVPPDNKPPAKAAGEPIRREIPLWRPPTTPPPGPRLAQDRPRLEEPPRPSAQAALPKAIPAAGAVRAIPPAQAIQPAPEQDGEERFYLEPLE